MTPHIGNTRPVPPSTWVLVRLGPNDEHVEQAQHLNWGEGLGPNGEGRIEAYAVIQPQPNA